MSKKLISASQIKNVSGCARKWYFEYIDRIKQPKTDALQDGIDFHDVIDHIYKEKEFSRNYPEKIIEMVTEAWETGLFDLDTDNYESEVKIQFDVDENHYLRGYVDLVDYENHVIVDHKTVKEFKWGLSEDDLKVDVQMMVYSYWYLSKFPEVEEIGLRHNQVLKKNPKKSRPVETTVTREHVMRFWEEKILRASKALHLVRQRETADDVPCNTKNCYQYGECHLLSRGKCNQ